MSQLKRLSIVDLEYSSINLDSPHLSKCRVEIDSGKAVLHLAPLSFWLLFISMLQEIHGEDIASHLPSFGLGREEADLDMIETILDNMSRILNEVSECVDWGGPIDEVIKRKFAETRGLPK